MLAGALTDSPMWLPWAAYWIGWAVFQVVRWWVVTATRNMESIAPLASVVYWWLVWVSASSFGWAWKRLKGAYGLREAVDFGESAERLGKLAVTLVRGQTKIRVQSAALAVLVSGVAFATLLALGILGAWSLVVVVTVPAVWWVRRLNGARWE
jgi:hypothetical protein